MLLKGEKQTVFVGSALVVCRWWSWPNIRKSLSHKYRSKMMVSGTQLPCSLQKVIESVGGTTGSVRRKLLMLPKMVFGCGDRGGEILRCCGSNTCTVTLKLWTYHLFVYIFTIPMGQIYYLTLSRAGSNYGIIRGGQGSVLQLHSSVGMMSLRLNKLCFLV